MDTKSELIDNLVQEFRRGTLVLSVLLVTEDPVYGYSLVTCLQERGIDIEQNTLYPLLRRLEKQGLLASNWDSTENRPRRYYSLTTTGRAIRDLLITEWEGIDAAIRSLIKKGGNK